MSLLLHLSTRNNAQSLSRGQFTSPTMNTGTTHQRDFTIGMNGVAMNIVTIAAIRQAVPKNTITV
jgi:hypothetical protein